MTWVIMDHGLSSEQREGLLFGNAARVFGLTP
jgi:hypothetical protein